MQPEEPQNIDQQSDPSINQPPNTNSQPVIEPQWSEPQPSSAEKPINPVFSIQSPEITPSVPPAQQPVAATPQPIMDNQFSAPNPVVEEPVAATPVAPIAPVIENQVAEPATIPASKKSKKGMIIIIIVLVVIAILGALGFLYWKNFMQPVAANAETNADSGLVATVPVPSEVELTEIAYDQTNGSGLAIKYPKTWTIAHKTSSKPNINTPFVTDTSTITSPDSAIVINFAIGLEAQGGTCNPDDSSITVAQIETAEIPGYSTNRFEAAIINDTLNKNYYYKIGAINADEAQLLKVGGTSCYLGLGLLDTKQSNNIASELTLIFPNIQDFKATTLADVNKAMMTDNYQIAKRIIQSLYVKS